MPNQWEDFYDRHAPYYDRGVFTHHTVAEVDFLLEVLDLAPGARVLDLGCGTGRHAVELARRGFAMTGVDISSGMLLQAHARARQANVDVEWVHRDATEYVAREPFDAVLCLCGSAFAMPDIEADPERHDRALLARAHAALVPGGPFVLTTPNGYRRIRELTPDDVASGRFDPATMLHVREETFTVGGAEGPMRFRERLYILPELVRMLEEAGFAVDHTWGGTAGRWARRPLELDEMEALVVAHRRP